MIQRFIQLKLRYRASKARISDSDVASLSPEIMSLATNCSSVPDAARQQLLVRSPTTVSRYLGVYQILLWANVLQWCRHSKCEPGKQAKVGKNAAQMRQFLSPQAVISGVKKLPSFALPIISALYYYFYNLEAAIIPHTSPLYRHGEVF